jgi:transposase InsO family protein
VAVRYAEQPGEAVNIDICFVPSEHLGQVDLPAVSGSSGRLVLCHRPPKAVQPAWPGQVFAQADLTYGEAMADYIRHTRDRLQQRRSPRALAEETPSAWREEHERQDQWYRIRQRRQQEDRAWVADKAAHRQARQDQRACSRAERKQQRTSWQSQQQAWQQRRAQHRQDLRERPMETAAWHARNQRTERIDLTGGAFPWTAILVITDNCTRQCLGLPLFQSGAHLTSQELIQALGQCLPPSLAYLISDQDGKFRSQALAQLADQRGFVHVPVYRHRPQSNGIAERFVLTLKNWLECYPWCSFQQLAVLLALFQQEYNNRPHQGLPIPGLSPNEFANRIYLM